MPPPPPCCGICHDDLSDQVPPYATTCGHLYCNECTTFHFSYEQETPCPICRTPITHRQLFKLFFDFNAHEGRERTGGNERRTDREVAEASSSRPEVVEPSPLREEDIYAEVEDAENMFSLLQSSAPDLQLPLDPLKATLTEIKQKLDQLSTIRASQRDSNSMALLVLEYENKLSHARRASKSDNRALQDAIAQAEQERVNLREELEVALDETRRAERERDTHLTALVEMTTQRDEWQSRSSTYKAKYRSLKRLAWGWMDN